MKNTVTIAIDAMGGENAPYKTINGLNIFLNKNKKINDIHFNLYGNQDLIFEELSKYNINKSL